MKKAKTKAGRPGGSKKQVSIAKKATVIKDDNKKEVFDIDDEDTGFGAWLKTGDGVEWMRIFVIGNSIAVFLTMTWPQMQKIFRTAVELIYGEE